MREGKIIAYHKGYGLKLEDIRFDYKSGTAGNGLCICVDPTRWKRAGSTIYEIKAKGTILDLTTHEDAMFYLNIDGQLNEQGIKIPTLEYIAQFYGVDIIVNNKLNAMIKSHCITHFEDKGKNPESLSMGTYNLK
jgi:hypothetical protein